MKMTIERHEDGRFALTDGDGGVIDLFATEAEAQADLERSLEDVAAAEFLVERIGRLMADAAERFPKVSPDTLFIEAEEALKDACPPAPARR